MNRTSSSRLSIVLLLVVAAPGWGGCSFMFATAPPTRVDPGSYFECGTPTMALVADVGIAAYGGIGVVNAIDRGEIGWVGVAAGVVALGLGSAVYGRAIRARCDRAQAGALKTRDLSPLRVPLAPGSGAAAPPVAPLRVQPPVVAIPPAAAPTAPADAPPPYPPVPPPLPE